MKPKNQVINAITLKKSPSKCLDSPSISEVSKEYDIRSRKVGIAGVRRREMCNSEARNHYSTLPLRYISYETQSCHRVSQERNKF